MSFLLEQWDVSAIVVGIAMVAIAAIVKVWLPAFTVESYGVGITGGILLGAIFALRE